MVLVQIMALEEQASEDGLDGECLPVWEVGGGGGARHARDVATVVQWAARKE